MHRRRKRDIVIELTALLDVIMIMIFMVMNENGKLVEKQQGMLDAAQQEAIAQAGEIDDLTQTIADLSDELADVHQLLDEEGLSDIHAQLQAAESRLEGYQSIDGVVIILNVSLENKYNNRIRCLSFGNPADPDHESEVHNISDDKEFSASVNRLSVFISEQTKQISSDDPSSPAVYVVFSYDPNNIYQEDFAAVDKVLKNAESRANSANFRYRPNPQSE